MAIWFVDGDFGSDSNTWRSADAPRRTLPADAAVGAGDTLNLAGTIRSGSGGGAAFSFTKDRLRFRAWVGRSPPVFYGGTDLASSGWTASSNAWQRNIGAGITISAVVYAWATSIDANGSHYGHLIPDTLANVQAGTGALGRYHYNSGSGVLSVYLGGVDPKASAVPVTYCACDGVIGLSIIGGGRHVVDGISFHLYPGDGQCYGVRIDNAQHSTISRGAFHDCGYHACGFYNTLGGGSPSVGNRIVSCTFNGLKHNGTYTVHYQDDALGDLTGCEVAACTIQARRYLGTTGATRSGLGAMSCIGIYAHSNAGANIADFLISDCTITGLEPGLVPMTAANLASPSDRAAWVTYPLRSDNCTVTLEDGQWTLDGDNAHRRLQFRQNGQCPSGYGARAVINLGWDGGSQDRHVLFEGSTFDVNLSETVGNATAGFSVAVGGGDARIRLINCSWHNRGTNVADRRNVFDNRDADTRFFSARGCIFSHLYTGPYTGVMSNNSGVSAGNIDLQDCAYWNMTLWSMKAAIDTAAEWAGVIDPSAVVLPEAPFPDAPDLRPGPASAIRTRASSLVKPSACLGAKYNGRFGAWMRVRRARGRSRWRIRA